MRQHEYSGGRTGIVIDGILQIMVLRGWFTPTISGLCFVKFGGLWLMMCKLRAIIVPVAWAVQSEVLDSWAMTPRTSFCACVTRCVGFFGCVPRRGVRTPILDGFEGVRLPRLAG